MPGRTITWSSRFDPMALLARFRVAQRIIAYQQELPAAHRRPGSVDCNATISWGKCTANRVAAPDSPALRRPPRPIPPAPALACGRAPHRAPTESIGCSCAASPRSAGQPQPVASEEAPWGQRTQRRRMGAPGFGHEGLWMISSLKLTTSPPSPCSSPLLGRIPVSERRAARFSGRDLQSAHRRPSRVSLTGPRLTPCWHRLSPDPRAGGVNGQNARLWRRDPASTFAFPASGLP